MAKSLLVTGGPQHSTVTSSTNYYSLGNVSNFKHFAENTRQTKIRAAGVLSKLCITVVLNTTTSATTIKTRKNGADGAMIVTIGAGATGIFEDLTHTDTVAANDLFGYQITTGTGGAVDFLSMSVVFTPTSSSLTYTPLINLNPGSTALATASSSQHLTLSGEIYLAGTTESHVQSEARVAGTLKALSVFIAANTRTTATTFRVRKNGVNGNQVVSVGAGVTGLIEDLTNTDTFAVNDLLNTIMTTGTGTGSIEPQFVKVDFETTTDNGMLLSAYVFGRGQDAVNTSYYTVGGELASGTFEPFLKTKISEPFTFSKMGLRIESNTLSAACTMRFRKNETNGNQIITIPAGTTGWLEDTTNTDVCVGTDEITYVITPGGGTGVMNIRSISMTTLLTSLRNLTRTSSDSIVFASTTPRLRNKIKTRADSVALTGGAPVRLRGKLRTVPDSIALTESISRIRTTIETIAHSLLLSHTNSRLVSKARTLSGSIGFSHGHSWSSTRIRNISENINLVSDAVRIRLKSATVLDSYALIDTSLRLRGKLRSITESMSLASTHQTFASRLRTILHNLNFTDFIQTKRSNPIKTISASLTFSSSHSKSRSRIRTILESLSLSDTSIQGILRSIIKSISDNLSFDGAHSISKVKLKSISDSLDFSSNFSRSRPLRIKLINEALVLSDGVSRIKLLVLRGFNQNLNFSSTSLKSIKSTVKHFVMKIKRFKLFRYN